MKIALGMKGGFLYLVLSVLAAAFVQHGLHRDLPDLLTGDEPTRWLVIVATLVPVIEELIFRVIPLTAVLLITQNRFAVGAVLILSAVVFGVAHGTPWNILVQGLGGIILGILYIRYGIVAPIVAHMTVNTTGVLLLQFL